MFESLFDTAVSKDVLQALALAQQEAADLGAPQVENGHVLLALMLGPLGDLLHYYGAERDKLRAAMRQERTRPEPFTEDMLCYSDEIVRLVEHASILAKTFSHDQITLRHLFKSLMVTPLTEDSVKVMMLRCGCDIRALEIKADIMLKLQKPDIAPYLEAEKQAWPGAESTTALDAAAPEAPRKRNHFTQEMEALIVDARSRAEQLNHAQVGVEHLLLSLAESDFRGAAFARSIVKMESVAYRLSQFESPQRASFLLNTPVSDGYLFDSEAKTVLAEAWNQARTRYEEGVSCEHLLLGILALSESINLFHFADHGKLAIFLMQLRGQLDSENRSAPLLVEPLPQPDSEDEVIIVTSRVLSALRSAKGHAGVNNQFQAEAPHLVLGLIAEALNSEVDFVKNRENKVREIRELLSKKRGLPSGEEITRDSVVFAPGVWQLLVRAKAEAQRTRTEKVDLNHLAIAVLSSEKELADELAKCSGIAASALQIRLQQCIFWQHHRRMDVGVGIELRKETLDEQVISNPPKPASLVVTRRCLEDALSDRSNMVMGFAVLEARKLRQSQISIENIMVGLVHESFGITFDVFNHLNISEDEVRDNLAWLCIRASDRTAARRDLSRNGWLLLEKALSIAQRWHDKEIEPEHILLAIADEQKGIASLACEALVIDGDELRLELTRRMIEARKTASSQP